MAQFKKYLLLHRDQYYTSVDLSWFNLYKTVQNFHKDDHLDQSTKQKGSLFGFYFHKHTRGIHKLAGKKEGEKSKPTNDYVYAETLKWSFSMDYWNSPEFTCR